LGAVCHVDNLDCKIVRLLLKVKCLQHWISCIGLPPDGSRYHKCRACNCTGGSECGRKQNSRTIAPILKCFLVERGSNARALGILPIDNGGPSALMVPYKYNFGHAHCGPPAATEAREKSQVARWANQLDAISLMRQLTIHHIKS
jgi:hypothetical protein